MENKAERGNEMKRRKGNFEKREGREGEREGGGKEERRGKEYLPLLHGLFNLFLPELNHVRRL